MRLLTLSLFKEGLFSLNYPKIFDVIVIGGGHAGTEAALAAARMGCNTLLLTQNIETIGIMSCNPAIGGIGKSHLVKEIDALGGAMALATDYAGIQFRTLNSRKGPAVRATRAQADRTLYRNIIRNMVENQKNLYIFQQTVDDLIIENNKIAGVVTQMGLRFKSHSVVLTVGTFLGGIVHVGLEHHAGGRAGDSASNSLSKKLRDLFTNVKRLKTGTPPRIDARSVDFTKMQEQPGDDILPIMSFLGDTKMHPEQVSCFITHTNENTHNIIRHGLDRSPLFTGIIEGVGPRYCPSIEDKIHRYADKSSHQIFIEPEGLNSQELYPNGISTSLPFDIQLKLVRSIVGMENAHITRPGYAIEYDFFDPKNLTHNLESKELPGLFLAGQINGTTGYEEAAAQGLLAGTNAALKVKNKEYWSPRRDESYIGVMVDDLVTLGTKEPYRMFTSRAEYRLLLREDNADLRLTESGYNLGLVNQHRWKIFNEKKEAIEREQQRLKDTWIKPSTPECSIIEKLTGTPLTHEYNLMELLRRPEISYQDLKNIKGHGSNNKQVADQIEIQARYAGYIDRQQADIEKLKRHENTKLPIDFDYESISGLSNEVKQKLQSALPESLAAASRIPGVTPAAISLLLIYLKKDKN